ncbi:hypothetical protein [Pseudomonas syringae]|uniref:hypothetical protein n=1 Tax=Pseudomonas syringae TaxID=317 RepID=UPI003F75395F
MADNLSYSYVYKIKIKQHTFSRVKSSVEKFSTSIYSSSSNTRQTERSLRYTVLANIEGTPAKLEIIFLFNANEIYETQLYLQEKSKHINSYTLKFFAVSLVQDVLINDHNEELKKYTIRTYSRYYGCFAIFDTIVINTKPRFLIKPQPWQTREEPLSEQILMFDTEVQAVNIEHARSIAYNHTANVNAYLSALLDCGFEMVSSEFRIFNIKNQSGIIQSMRFRTGVVDEQLGLLVKDNHYGLKDLYDDEQVDSYDAGKLALSFTGTREDGGLEHYSTEIVDNFSNNDFLEATFSKHIITPPSGTKERGEPPRLSDEPHYLTVQLRLPVETRKFFKGIAALNEKQASAFLGCCRLYNLALTTGRRHPTLAQSYKVCAVEALAFSEDKTFSEFMLSYSKPGFDKDLSDYFYSVRSKHFHAGKFLFDEYDVEFQRDIAFSFQAKHADFDNFSRYIRIAIISWVRLNLLSLE